jgi:hypothetical protein
MIHTKIGGHFWDEFQLIASPAWQGGSKLAIYLVVTIWIRYEHRLPCLPCLEGMAVFKQ